MNWKKTLRGFFKIKFSSEQAITRGLVVASFIYFYQDLKGFDKSSSHTSLHFPVV